MLLDVLERLIAYAALHPRLHMAIDFLNDPRNTALEPPGIGHKHSLRKTIHGDDAFAIIQRYRTKPPHEAFWEAHRTYIDVQCVIEDEELMGWAPLNALNVQHPYDAQKDYAVLHECNPAQPAGRMLLVRSGECAIFFPEDAHMPGVSPNGVPREVKKIVVKLRA